MPASNVYALLIGAAHYPDYPGAGLRGATNDAAWWRRVCVDTLGVPAENVRLLLAPTGAAADAASADAIRDGIRWLGTQLHAVHAAGGRPAGLITYSGHGAAGPDTGLGAFGTTLAVAGSDLRATEDGGLEGVVLLSEMQQILAGIAAPDAPLPQDSWVHDVTVALDCCYAAVPRLVTSPSAPEPHNLMRVLLGCDPWRVSYEIATGGRDHGAFTFALLTLLEQWKVRHENGGAWFEVSAQTLLQRTNTLLDMFGLDQQAMTATSPRGALVPFLRPSEEVWPGMTTAAPNRRRPTAQLETPEGNSVRVYQLTGTVNGAPQQLAVIVLTGKDRSQTDTSAQPRIFLFEGNVENWFVNADLPSASNVTALQLTVTYDGTPTPTSAIAALTPISGAGVHLTSPAVWQPTPGGAPAPLQGSDPVSGQPLRLAIGTGAGPNGANICWQIQAGGAVSLLKTVQYGEVVTFSTPDATGTWNMWTANTSLVGPGFTADFDPNNCWLQTSTPTPAPWGLGYTLQYRLSAVIDGVEGPLGPIKSIVSPLNSSDWGTLFWNVPYLPPPQGATNVVFRVYRRVIGTDGHPIQRWKLVQTIPNTQPITSQNVKSDTTTLPT